MRSLWRSVGGKEVTRFEAGLFPAGQEPSELFMRLAGAGTLLDCSQRLRRCLAGRWKGGNQCLADLVLNAPPWLRLAPEQWPRETGPLEFESGDGEILILAGLLSRQAEGWLLMFLDLSAVLGRSRNIERRHQLLQHGARFGNRLRGPGVDGNLVLDDWLSDVALRLRIPWLVVLVRDDTRWQAVAACHADLAAGAPTVTNLAAMAEAAVDVPWQGEAPAGDPAWLVPYVEDGRAVAWLCCGVRAAQDVRWLDPDDWSQLFALVAAPWLWQRRRERMWWWQQRYHALERLCSGGWWEYDPHAQVFRISATLWRQWGHESSAPDTLARDQWFDLLAPADRDGFSARLEAVAARGDHFAQMARMRRGTASVWYNFEASHVGEGDNLRLLGFALDVDRIRRREEAADATTARLAGLVDSAPGVIYVQQYDEGALRPVFCSGSLQTLLGWTLEDLPDRSFISLVHPEDHQLYLERNQQLLRLGRASMQYRVRNREGVSRWIQDEARLLRDEKGQPVEVIGLYLDITEAKEAAERVFRSEESYRLLVDDSPAIICRYQPNLQVIFANPTLAAELDIERAQVEGLNLGDYLSDEQRQAALARLRGLTPANPFASSEICIRRSDMNHRWWVMYERGLFDEYGNLLEVQAVGRDNTEVHQTRQQLFQSAKMATLGEMATGLAHEINQPLSVIQMTLTNVLARAHNATVTRDYLVEKLERIAGQVQRAAGIVNHVCIFGRWSGVEGILFSPTRSVHGALSLVGQKLKLLDIQVRLDGVADLPEIKGQPDRLEQVLINLIMNASYALRERKSTEPQLRPYVCISGRISDGVVRLCVEDNGGGIPPVLLDRIFEPFFTTKPLDQGTGLGLSVSREIISQMFGTLRVQNHADGARFLIDLPLPAGDGRAAVDGTG